MTEKIQWSGMIVSVQPRIRLLRSFDERQHAYLGYSLAVETEGDILHIAIGKAAQAKHGFRVGDRVRGNSLPVADPRRESAGFYKTSGLKLLERAASSTEPPPWHGTPPDLTIYRERGHRRLAARTYDAKCSTCIWGCRMPVEMTIDQWNPRQKRYRFETFCYGPLACPLYSPGATRKVPGRKGMSYEEEDWIDEEATGHRGPWD